MVNRTRSFTRTVVATTAALGVVGCGLVFAPAASAGEDSGVGPLSVKYAPGESYYDEDEFGDHEWPIYKPAEGADSPAKLFAGDKFHLPAPSADERGNVDEYHSQFAGTVQPLSKVPCAEAAVDIDVAIQAKNLGPAAAGSWHEPAGAVLYTDTEGEKRSASSDDAASLEPDESAKLSLDGQVLLSDLQAGKVKVGVNVKGYGDNGYSSWDLSGFDINYDITCPPVTPDLSFSTGINEKLTIDRFDRHIKPLDGQELNWSSFTFIDDKGEETSHVESAEGRFSVTTGENDAKVQFEPAKDFSGEVPAVTYQIGYSDWSYDHLVNQGKLKVSVGESNGSKNTKADAKADGGTVTAGADDKADGSDTKADAAADAKNAGADDKADGSDTKADAAADAKNAGADDKADGNDADSDGSKDGDSPEKRTLMIDHKEITAADFVKEDKGVTVTAKGFDEGEKVTLDVVAGPKGVKGIKLEDTANEDGVVAFSIYGTDAKNPSVYLGKYDVEVTGANDTGDDKALTGSFVVVSGESGNGGSDNGNSGSGNGNGGSGDGGGNLPRTGAELAGLTAGAGLLAIGGAAVVLTLRRKTKNS